jgi:phage terminase large subunit-like protein
MPNLPQSADLSAMPMKPTPRQAEFLKLNCEEALYGGAAGGGKSEALLMWLAEGIHIPTYSAIIFRRTYKQLTKSNDSLVAKSFRLYKPLGGDWNSTRMQWRFPSGAIIEMGALEHLNSIYDYQGPAFHRIAFDELTQFQEEQYLYLFSRIRAVQGFPVRMGMRASANPGGIGHAWVKQRFINEESLAMLRGLDFRQPSPPGTVYWNSPDRAFVPARLADNPWLKFDEYVKSLGHLSPVTRERLLNGDWSVIEDALVKSSWLRYYDMRGQIIRLYDQDGKMLCHEDERNCRRFATLDTAGTTEDKAKESKGKPPSWSVMAVWDVLPAKYGKKLVLRYVWRKRVGFTDLAAGVRAVHREWRPASIKVEDKHFGPALWDLLRGEMPITTISTGGKDKVTRAAPLLNMLERGEGPYLPKYDDGGWRAAYEAELLSWQGLEDETSDQIDVSSYAAMEVQGGSSQTLKVDHAFWR